MNKQTVDIRVMSDGNRTVAEAVTYNYPDTGLVTGSGSSGREPGDKYDRQTGEDLAVARALRSLAGRLERRARGRVNHAESCKAHKAQIAERNASAPGFTRVPLENPAKAPAPLDPLEYLTNILKNS